MLPQDINLQEFFSNLRPSPELWLKDAKSIFLKEKIPFNNFIPFPDGSNLIASVDGRYVLKIFPPFHRHQWESEYKSLQHVQGKISIAVPELVAKGEIDNWTYVIITKLEGVSLENVWNEFSSDAKLRTMKKIGELMKEVHSIDVTGLELEPKWDNFILDQLAGYKVRHQKRRMPEWFIDGVDEFIRENLHLMPNEVKPVLLTGEYTPFNLLADSNGIISGMIDFGDAMTGYHEYDLLGPVIFLVSGDPELFKALLNGYGYAPSQLNENLQRRLMYLQVLHRYSNFNGQLRIEGWREKVDNFGELMKLIFPV